MINDIQESNCSFIVSKWLNEKGFNCYCPNAKYYDTRDKEHNYPLQDNFYNQSLCSTKERMKYLIVAPTHSLALLWLRINFGIYIHATIQRDGLYECNVNDIKGDWIYCVVDNDTFDRAIELGLKYALLDMVN